MIDTSKDLTQEEKDKLHYEIGELMYKRKVKYNSPELKNPAYRKGWTDEEKRSRAGWSYFHWFKSSGYKTSSDLSTLF
jgi:hypothetical protein